jgi:hypothetical protein
MEGEMPDSGGKLNELEKADLRIKIDKIWTGSAKNCPICGSNKWFLGDHVVESPIINQEFRGFGSTAYPAVLLISELCGYTIYFNAVILGVTSRRSA